MRLRLADGIGLAYSSVGAGDPVLLIAGTGYPASTWWPPSVDTLGARHTVITYDHRGTGDSGSSEGRYTTRLLASDAAALIEAVSDVPVHVVGHSMGGRVAQWVAIDDPDHVRSLTLVASGAGPSPDEVPRSNGIPVRTVLELVESGFDGLIRRQMTRAFFTPEYLSEQPERLEWLFEAFWTKRPSLEDYLKHVEARQGHDAYSFVHTIIVPTLVVVGTRDTHPGGTGSHVEQSRALSDRIPHAALRYVEGAAHGLFWQNPEQLEQLLLDWWALAGNDSP